MLNRTVILLLATLPPAMAESTPAPLERRNGDWLLTVEEGLDEPRSIGSYTLRLYRNSRDRFVAGMTRPRDGSVQDAWLHDLDGDGRMEVVIWLVSAGSGGYARLDLFTVGGAELVPIELRDPATLSTQGYQGHDRVRLEAGRLIRSFPRYLPGDSMAAPSDGNVEYWLDYPTREWRSAP